MDLAPPQAASKLRPSSSRAHSLVSKLNQRRSGSGKNVPAVPEDIDVADLTPGDWDISPTLVESHAADDAKVVSGSELYEVQRSYEDVTLQVDLEGLRARYQDARSRSTSPWARIRFQNGIAPRNDAVVEHANLASAASDEVASAALSRIISKGDFMHMNVVGQFNLGFIIVRKRTPRVDVVGKEEPELGFEDDLFVVDQHAADEKWNFESLQETTVIDSQRLFRPQPLNLTAADELVALENLDVLKRNGFEVGPVEVSAGIDCDEEESSPNARLHLIAQPVSKDTVFDMKDLEELVHLMQDRPKGTMVRCSKARAMFAMRACRRSVMIGRPLDRSRMTTIIRHMASMDQPWNCPHGRPTMRHLSDLTSFGGYNSSFRAVNWREFGGE
ncbi:MutL C terminal dimerization domain-containing protein [Pisolithus albus]|nr:MutL C terminal dimerization domain-containing protein [Pisolithus albus]